MIPVLYLIEHLRQGGSERYVAELVRSAREMDIEPHVGCFAAGGIFYDDILKSGVPLETFPLETLYHPAALGTARSIVRYIRRNNIRVVHCFQPNANILGTLAGKWAGARVVISRRNLGDFAGLGSPRLAWFQRHVTNRWCDRVLANSRAVREAAIGGEGFPREKVCLIYNGLDTERFRPVSDPGPFRRALGLPEEGFVFGVVSGFRPVKGVDVVIRAFARTLSDCSGAVLALAGDGPERGRLEGLVRQLALEGRVVFLGVRPDMESVYPAFDAFVLTSHSEGFSNAILEAMGTGLPVVASAVGGNVEMLEDGVRGFLVPPGETEILSDRMKRLVSDPVLSRAMGKEARKWVEQTNSRGAVVRRFREFYGEVLDGR
jgi:glycosyltransferase involved in cell wall biosynthesis